MRGNIFFCGESDQVFVQVLDILRVKIEIGGIDIERIQPTIVVFPLQVLALFGGELLEGFPGGRGVGSLFFR